MGNVERDNSTKETLGTLHYSMLPQQGEAQSRQQQELRARALLDEQEEIGISQETESQLEPVARSYSGCFSNVRSKF